MSDPILFSYGLNGKTAGKSLSGKDIASNLKSENLAWVHLDGTHPNATQWLNENLTYLDPFIAKALLADETRPRVSVIGDGVLMILRGINMNANASPEDMISVRLWVDAHRIISVQLRASKSVHSLAEQISQGKGPQNAGSFVSLLTERLNSYISPVITELDEAVDELEVKLLDEPDPKERHEIVEARRKTIVIRRFLAPQKDAIAQLRDSILTWLSPVDRRHLSESFHALQRNVEDLDALRERTQVVQDELNSALADRLNRNMYILSVIAAIFLPLGFLTGLLGINIGGIPGADNPNAFVIFIVGMFVVVLVQIWVFRKMRWF
jgi:zinc transporter